MREFIVYIDIMDFTSSCYLDIGMDCMNPQNCNRKTNSLRITAGVRASTDDTLRITKARSNAEAVVCAWLPVRTIFF